MFHLQNQLYSRRQNGLFEVKMLVRLKNRLDKLNDQGLLSRQEKEEFNSSAHKVNNEMDQLDYEEAKERALRMN